MSGLNNLLIAGAPKELFEFVSGCASGDDLVEKLKKDPSRLLSIIQNIKVEGNGSLAARLLHQVNPKDLEDPVVKKVETALRNRGMLNRGVGKLKNLCDDQLCNSLGDFKIEKSDMDEWLGRSEIAPKFTMLLSFVNRAAGSSDLDTVIKQMQTPEGAARLAAECTPEEIEVFATLKTEFGKACQIPPGTFGKVEWEKAFPVTIKDEDVPPLPSNIHAILEQEDPWESWRKLKDTCMLFLRPKKVILHEEGGDREVELGFDGVEELAKKATNVWRRTQYKTLDETLGIRNQMNKMPVEEPAWVLMRKELIHESRDKIFVHQQELLEGSCFEVPKTMDAIFLNIITYAWKGICLYKRDHWCMEYTNCQEQYKGHPIAVGGFKYSRGLEICCDPHDLGRIVDGLNYGLSCTWKL